MLSLVGRRRTPTKQETQHSPSSGKTLREILVIHTPQAFTFQAAVILNGGFLVAREHPHRRLSPLQLLLSHARIQSPIKRAAVATTQQQQ